MADCKACYRELRKYKYQLVGDYTVDVGIDGLAEDVDTDFITLTTGGLLTVRERYAWDGPSGPTFDTRSFMRGSLVHDALYQLMRQGHLDYTMYRKRADELLRSICVADGMSGFRAWYVYQAVRLFAEKNARPGENPQDEIICVP